MKKLIQELLNKFGVQIQRYPSLDLRRRLKIMNYCQVNVLIDIGASTGQYAKEMRKIGYIGKIFSFEPRKSAYNLLKINTEKDKDWTAYNYAIGNKDGKDLINISGATDSSSILNILPKHIEVYPKSKYINKEEIEIKKLDSIFNTIVDSTNNVMIKIDTQGYEKYVLEGAAESLERVITLQLEMSLVSLYEKEMLWKEMLDFLEVKGFELYSVENGTFEPKTGQLLQIDGIFVNNELLKIPKS